MKSLIEYWVHNPNGDKAEDGKPLHGAINIDVSKDSDAAHKYLWTKYPNASSVATSLAGPEGVRFAG